MGRQAAGLVVIVAAATLALGGLGWTAPVIGLLLCIAATRRDRLR
ncbi:hypothetical protein ABEV34_05015 [Methylorubrum rhodesianum]